MSIQLSAKAYEALGHDQRLSTVLYLAGNPDATVGEIKAAVAPRATRPGFSRHLRVLRNAGLVTMRIDEQWRRYTLNGPLRDWLRFCAKDVREEINSLRTSNAVHQALNSENNAAHMSGEVWGIKQSIERFETLAAAESSKAHTAKRRGSASLQDHHFREEQAFMRSARELKKLLKERACDVRAEKDDGTPKKAELLQENTISQ